MVPKTDEVVVLFEGMILLSKKYFGASLHQPTSGQLVINEDYITI